jgi:Fic family protein
MNKNVLKFLKQSNYIESEYTQTALNDAIEAWNYVKSETRLSHRLIREVHFLLMREIAPYIAGMYREKPVRIAGRECPHPSHVHSLIDKWVQKANVISLETLDPEIMWAKIKYLHVEFERIHPFADGNGRVGRILMNWQRKSANLPILIIHQGEEQQEYYKWFAS